MLSAGFISTSVHNLIVILIKGMQVDKNISFELCTPHNFVHTHTA